jgi:hypothetical protein
MEKQNSNGNRSAEDSSLLLYAIVILVFISIFTGIFFWYDIFVFNNKIDTVQTVTEKIIQTQLLIEKFEGMVKTGNKKSQPGNDFVTEKKMIKELKKRMSVLKKQLSELN